MTSSTSGRSDGSRRAERLAPDDPDEPHRPPTVKSWEGTGGSEHAAGWLERRRIRLGRARLTMSPGLLCLLAAGVLSLPPYSAAVLMGLVGTAGMLTLRSP